IPMFNIIKYLPFISDCKKFKIVMELGSQIFCQLVKKRRRRAAARQDGFVGDGEKSANKPLAKAEGRALQRGCLNRTE
ncbi:MAG: hypothetical protein RR350_00925, partial [Oscillibacter sp.]